MTTSRTRQTIHGCSQAEGDRICRMVLELLDAIRSDRGAPTRRPAPERIGPSADNLHLERLLREPPARTTVTARPRVPEVS